MRRLVWTASFGKKQPVHPFEAGDLCMAKHDGGKYCLATVVDFRKRKVVFFDDGTEAVVDVPDIREASAADRELARVRYELALSQAKEIASADAEDIIQEAIECVEITMGGSLGDDGMISYSNEAGAESEEGRLLCEHLIGKFGALGGESPAIAWMRSHWREVCEHADVDRSGTISEEEAVEIWDQVTQSISTVITKKLDLLGAPPRLYRGDLCLALPADAASTAAGSDGRPRLATYMDSGHVCFFDGDSSAVSPAQQIVPATPAAKEAAILRYTKAVAQCKAAARRPSDQVVRAAVERVKADMGGTLGRDNAINYRADAGEEAQEGMLLLRALVANFGALRSESRAVEEIETNWKVACAQADEDNSGTISVKECVAIWDRMIIEMTRSCTAKLDKLGINPVPHILSEGDLCMVRPTARDSEGHSDPTRLYLATYVDPTHAIFFDASDEVPREVAKIGPATQADKDVAIVKYSQALSQCMRLLQVDAADIVEEAIAEVRAEVTLGADGQINYRQDAGEEAREGRKLCEALVSNLGALWDESPSVTCMMEQWAKTCADADADSSGTISAEEAAEIWTNVLQVFMKFIASKLSKLGVATRKPRKSPSSASNAANGDAAESPPDPAGASAGPVVQTV